MPCVLKHTETEFDDQLIIGYDQSMIGLKKMSFTTLFTALKY